MAEGDEEYDKLVEIQRLKAAIHFTVGQICEENEKDLKFTKPFIAAVAEATYRFSQTMARDLELFAKHAKRTTVNADDVLLFCRKSKTLSDHLHQKNTERMTEREEQGAKRKEKKKKSSVAAGTASEVVANPENVEEQETAADSDEEESNQ